MFPFIAYANIECSGEVAQCTTSPEPSLFPIFFSNEYAQTRGKAFMYRPDDNGLVRTEYVIVNFSYH